MLEEVGGRPVLELDVYTKAFPANPGHIAVISGRGGWKEDGRVVVVDIFDVGRLSPIEPKLENDGPAEAHVPYRAGGEPVESVLIPDHLPEGVHRAPRSRHAGLVEEVVFLAGGPGAPRGWTGSSPISSIYAWRPRGGELRVFPQRWFVSDRFDTGYQWITKARRTLFIYSHLACGLILDASEPRV